MSEEKEDQIEISLLWLSRQAEADEVMPEVSTPTVTLGEARHAVIRLKPYISELESLLSSIREENRELKAWKTESEGIIIELSKAVSLKDDEATKWKESASAQVNIINNQLFEIDNLKAERDELKSDNERLKYCLQQTGHF